MGYDGASFIVPTILFDLKTIKETIVGVLSFILVVSILVTMSCSIVLELIEQHESGKKMSLIRAGIDSWLSNFVKILPISLVYAFIWFVVTIINTLLNSKDNEDSNSEYSAENAARAIAGADKPFSLSALLSGYLLKIIRMLIFLILPGICWEKRGPWGATKRGWKIFRSHKGEFISGFFMTELAAAIVFLPVALVFFAVSEFEIKLSDVEWYVVILYTGAAWSYTMYLEQIFSAELFMWYKKWEEINIKSDTVIPLSEIEKPSLLDEVFEFQNKNKKT